MPIAWNNEETALVVKLWTEGQIATQIAHQFPGRHSRNSVIGKVHRLKLPTRETQNRTKAAARKGFMAGLGQKAALPSEQKARKASKQVTLPPLPINGPVATANTKELRSVAWEPLPVSVPKAMADLGDMGRDDKLGECRWPVGEDPVLFCACAAYGVYCPMHAALAAPKVREVA